MKALFVGLEQLVAVSILLTAVLLATGLLISHYRSSGLNSESAMEKLSAYYKMQQIAYAMATGNAQPVLNFGNQIKIMHISDYGPENKTCSLSYAAKESYVCGIATYSGKIYVIKVYQNA